MNAPIYLLRVCYDTGLFSHSDLGYLTSREEAERIATEINRWFEATRAAIPQVDQSLPLDKWNKKTRARDLVINALKPPHASGQMKAAMKNGTVLWPPATIVEIQPFITTTD